MATPFVLLAGDVAFYRTAEGEEHLKESIQDVLDRYRDIDIAAKIRHRQNAQQRQRQSSPEAASSDAARRSEGKPLSATKVVKGRNALIGREGGMHRCTALLLTLSTTKRQRYRR